MTTQDRALDVLFQKATRDEETRHILRTTYQELIDELACVVLTWDFIGWANFAPPGGLLAGC